MPKPKHPMAGKHLANNATKARKLPGKTKKKADPPQSTSSDRKQSAAASSKKVKKRSQRSILGFIAGAGACIALWGWSIYDALVKKKKDRRILDGMLRRPLIITDHAACRMDCRFITKSQIVQTLEKGVINHRKSDPRQKPCPKYVVDAHLIGGGSGGGGKGKTKTIKSIQGVFSACRNETLVVTVIDTDTDWPCGPC